MTRKTLELSDALYDYLLEVSLREPPLLERLREETGKLPYAQMQVAPDQGQFMALMVELTGARRVLEVGTFTGYSALAMALALPPDGRVLTCDIDPEMTAIARRYWAEAGVAERIELRLVPAAETLEALLGDGQAGAFDLAFIDADKKNYDTYYEQVLALLRPGGLMMIDNVLWSGKVADRAADDEDTRAIRALNRKVHGDERVSLALVPLSDGLTLARKR